MRLPKAPATATEAEKIAILVARSSGLYWRRKGVSRAEAVQVSGAYPEAQVVNTSGEETVGASERDVRRLLERAPSDSRSLLSHKLWSTHPASIIPRKIRHTMSPANVAFTLANARPSPAFAELTFVRADGRRADGDNSPRDLYVGMTISFLLRLSDYSYKTRHNP